MVKESYGAAVNFGRRSWQRGAVPVSGQAAMFVDFTPVINDIKAVLSKASEEIQKRATYNALNHVGDKALTRVRRHLAHQTSVKYGRIMNRVWSVRAHPGRLAYVIHAQDTAIPLKEFMLGGVPGAKKVTFRAWNEQHTLKKNVFVMEFGRGPVPMKRTGKHSHGPGKGPLNAKQLYGPVVPHEMLRKDKETLRYIASIVPLELLPRLEHEIAQAFGRAAKASGSFIGPMRDRGVDKRYRHLYKV